jgi:hypothetical protein
MMMRYVKGTRTTSHINTMRVIIRINLTLAISTTDDGAGVVQGYLMPECVFVVSLYRGSRILKL